MLIKVEAKLLNNVGHIIEFGYCFPNEELPQGQYFLKVYEPGIKDTKEIFYFETDKTSEWFKSCVSQGAPTRALRSLMQIEIDSIVYPDNS